MPVLKRADAEIYYEETGRGYPILLFGPGGMHSRIEMWHEPAGGPPRAWSDWTQVLAEQYRVIAMDQRNAGRSHGAVAANHDWSTYAGDQLALLDHLGIERGHVLGGCIGSSFCLKLAELAPQRLSCAVLQNPIGLNAEHPTYFPDGFAAWSKEQRAKRPELDPAALAAFGKRLWDGEFVYAVSRDFVRRCTVPCLLLPGDDTPHPAATSREIAAILPGVEVLQNWKSPAHTAAQRRAVFDFLAKHTPR